MAERTSIPIGGRQMALKVGQVTLLLQYEYATNILNGAKLGRLSGDNCAAYFGPTSSVAGAFS